MVLQQTVSSLWKLSMLPILVWLIFKSLVFPQGTLLLFLLLTTRVTRSVLQTSHPQVVPSGCGLTKIRLTGRLGSLKTGLAPRPGISTAQWSGLASYEDGSGDLKSCFVKSGKNTSISPRTFC